MNEADLQKILELTRPVLRHAGRSRAIEGKSPLYATEYLGSEQLEGHLSGYRDGMQERFMRAIEEYAGTRQSELPAVRAPQIPNYADSAKPGMSKMTKVAIGVAAVGVGLMVVSAMSKKR